MDGKLVGKTGQVKENYLPTRVRHILEVISKKDAEAMGFINGSHPRDLLCHAIMVPPNNSRQVIGSGLEKFHKPLSDSLNVLLKNRTKDPDQVFKLLRMMLVKSGAKGCVKEDKSLFTIMQGKHGILRFCVSGKSVDQTLRTVSNPDNTIALGEVRVPLQLMSNQTKEYLVTTRNRRVIVDMHTKGRVTHITREGTGWWPPATPERFGWATMWTSK